MSTRDVFGANPAEQAATTPDAAVDDIADRISHLLGAAFQHRESSFWNGPYDSHESDEYGEIKVLNNQVVEDPEDLPYENFSEYPVIVTVRQPLAADDLRNKLTSIGFVHLARESG